MNFKTGRSRTITISANISSILQVQDVLGILTWGFGNPAVSSNEVHVWGVATVGPGHWDYTLNAHVATGWPSGEVVVSDYKQGFFGNPTGSHTEDLSGQVTITFPVEEWIQITIGSWNGRDSMPRYDVTIYERLVAGTNNFHMLAKSGPCTVEVYKSITSADAAVVGIDYGMGMSATIPGGSIATTCSLTGSWNGTSISVPYTRSGGGCVASAAGGCLASTSGSFADTWCSMYAKCPKAYQLSGVVRAFKDSYAGNAPNGVKGTLGLKLDRFNVNASGQSGLGAHLDAVGGVFSDSYSQQQYNCSSEVNGATQDTVIVDEWTSTMEITARPGANGDGDNYSLLALGEDTRDVRALQRGPIYNSFTTYQDASAVVDDGTTVNPSGTLWSGQWQNNQNTTISGSGTEIVAATGIAAGGVPSFKRYFADLTGGGFAGFRYLAVKVRADANNRPVIIQIGSKQWSKDLGGATILAGTSAKTYNLDLCSPTNVTDDTDSVDTQWPFPTVDGPYYGVTTVKNMLFTGLDYSATYYVDNLKLYRKDKVNNVKLTLLAEHDNWLLEQPPVTGGGTTTSTYDHRFVLGVTDGRQSLEYPDAKMTVITSSGAPVIIYTQIDLKTMIGGIPGLDINPNLQPFPGFAGWHATANGSLPTTDPSDGGNFVDWLNNNRPATWAGGNGALWGKTGNYSRPNWSYSIDLDASNRRGAQTVFAQMLYDSIAWYPDCGDVFGLSPKSTGYKGPLVLVAAYMLRGQSHGLVFDTSGKSLPNIRVYITRTSDGKPGGFGTSDAQGIYITGIPSASANPRTPPPDDTEKTFPLSSNDINVTRLFHNRKRHRACFRVTPPQTCFNKLLYPSSAYFPFPAQLRDRDLLFLEEWRRIETMGSDRFVRKHGLQDVQPLRAAVVRNFVEHRNWAVVLNGQENTGGSGESGQGTTNQGNTSDGNIQQGSDSLGPRSQGSTP